MGWLHRTLGSSIGCKVLVAITGIMLAGFLVGHLSGNFISFAGRDAFNTYAYQMQSLGPLLWIARLGLLAALMVHIAAIVRLTAINRAARPERYRFKNTVQASLASRTMVYTGALVFAFIAFHLAHYTLFWVDPAYGTWVDDQGRHDAFRMLVVGFQNPLVSGFYVLSMILLGGHLSHGLASLFQTLGLNHGNFTPLIRKAAPALSWLLALGFISIPVSVLAGVIKFTGGAH